MKRARSRERAQLANLTTTPLSHGFRGERSAILCIPPRVVQPEEVVAWTPQRTLGARPHARHREGPWHRRDLVAQWFSPRAQSLRK
jgi:hypothetical protein